MLGINIGANKDSIGQKRVDDYIECFQKVSTYADYITVNISSPNTPGLRSLHSKENFLPLFKAISHVRETENFSNPIFIKLSPDEHIDVISEITKAIKEFNFDGVITSNTTIDKSNLIFESKADLSGGLSGKPLLEKSNELLSLVHLREPELLKIGVGGVHNKESFDMKFKKGIDMYLSTDVEPNSGLGASSSLTTNFVNVISHIINIGLEIVPSPTTLIE